MTFRSVFAFAGLLALSDGLRAQSIPNLDVEQIDLRQQLPVGWKALRPLASDVVRSDAQEHYSGRLSLRLERTTADSAGSFVAAALVLPLVVPGQSVTLTGYVKTQDVRAGHAGLWLRVDGADGPLARQSMQQDGPQGTTEWQAYSLTVPLGTGAKTVVVGGLLSGSGRAWVDHLAVSVDGQDRKTQATRDFPAQRDTAFQKVSGIDLAGLTPLQTEHLTVLAQVWGFVKYYHPAVAQGRYHWDKELFRVLPAVLRSPSAPARNQVLSAWLARLGPVPPCPACAPPDPAARVRPDLRWLADRRRLGRELAAQLTFLQANRHASPGHYYVSPAANDNAVFEHEEAYADLGNCPDAGYRLLALFRYWNAVEYFFPYKYAIGEDWRQVLPEFVPRFAAARDSLAYRLTVLALIARVRDSHAGLAGYDPTLDRYYRYYAVPAWLRFVGEQAVVAGFRNDAVGAAQHLRVGDVVTHVDGVPVAELVRRYEPITPASNGAAQRRDLARHLLRGATRQATLRVQRGGRDTVLTVPRGAFADVWKPTPAEKSDSSYRFVRPDVGYLSAYYTRPDQLPAALDAFRQTKGLVVDLRNNYRDVALVELAGHLVEQPTAFAKLTKPDLSYPGQFRFDKPVIVRPSGAPAYAGRVVILVDEGTQSAGEYLAMRLRAAPRALVLGSTTAGADGDVSELVLPGNLRTTFSGLGVYYPDGRETQRVGIVPDVEVRPTVAGIRAGRDELLEKAVEVIGGRK